MIKSKHSSQAAAPSSCDWHPLQAMAWRSAAGLAVPGSSACGTQSLALLFSGRHGAAVQLGAARAGASDMKVPASAGASQFQQSHQQNMKAAVHTSCPMSCESQSPCSVGHIMSCQEHGLASTSHLGVLSSFNLWWHTSTGTSFIHVESWVSNKNSNTAPARPFSSFILTLAIPKLPKAHKHKRFRCVVLVHEGCHAGNTGP